MTSRTSLVPTDPPSVVLITIGDELLSGERVDTNGPWMARFLEARGFAVREILTVGDAEDAILEALARALVRGRLVVTTGGLGPTSDDRTREAVSRLLVLPLREDETVRMGLEHRYRGRGLADLPARARRMAQLPEGAEVLVNGKGAAPGLALEVGSRRLVLLPGVPGEMQGLMESEVAPRLDRWFPQRPRPLRTVLVQTTGIAESVLAERLEAALVEGGRTPGVTVAYRPSLRGVELRFSAGGPDAEETLAQTLQAVAPVLEPHRYDVASGDLAELVLDRLAARQWRVAVAESCTGGLVAGRLTAVPGSSRVFLGGIVAYHDEVKSSLLGVPEEWIRTHGAVSDEVVRAMARGAAQRLGAEVAVAVSGVAGPGGGTPTKPVGLVWFGLHSPQGEWSWSERFSGGRDEVRERSAQYALQRLADAANPDPREG
jgi:nicotinamide-nucleotide amidase